MTKGRASRRLAAEQPATRPRIVPREGGEREAPGWRAQIGRERDPARPLVGEEAAHGEKGGERIGQG